MSDEHAISKTTGRITTGRAVPKSTNLSLRDIAQFLGFDLCEIHDEVCVEIPTESTPKQETEGLHARIEEFAKQYGVIISESTPKQSPSFFDACFAPPKRAPWASDTSDSLMLAYNAWMREKIIEDVRAELESREAEAAESREAEAAEPEVEPEAACPKLRIVPTVAKPEVDPNFGSTYPQCVFPRLQDINWDVVLDAFEKDGRRYIEGLWDDAHALTRQEQRLHPTNAYNARLPLYREYRPIPWTDRILMKAAVRSGDVFQALSLLPSVDRIEAVVSEQTDDDIGTSTAVGILMCYANAHYGDPSYMRDPEYYRFVRDVVELLNGIESGIDYRSKSYILPGQKVIIT